MRNIGARCAAALGGSAGNSELHPYPFFDRGNDLVNLRVRGDKWWRDDEAVAGALEMQAPVIQAFLKALAVRAADMSLHYYVEASAAFGQFGRKVAHNELV